MNYSITVVTEPTLEPVSRDAAKDHCRVDHTAEDSYFDGLIKAARELTELAAERRWLTQTLDIGLAGFPCDVTQFPGDGSDWWKATTVRLPIQPIQSLTWLKYYDSNGVQQTLASPQTWLAHDPPLVAPAPGNVWPAVESGRIESVTVRVVAGYTTTAKVPELVKHAMKLAVGYWYENRGDARDPHTLAYSLGLPPGASRLLGLLRSSDYR